MDLKKVIFLSIFLISINFVSAVIPFSNHINYQITDADGVATPGVFLVQINVTTGADCTGVVYQNNTEIKTDSNGVFSYYLDNTEAIDYDQTLYTCVYLDGILDQVFRDVPVPQADFARNVSITGVISDGNLSMGTFDIIANKFYGLFSWIINFGDGSVDYLTFNDTTLSFNELKLNVTIDDRTLKNFQASFDLNHSEINFNPFDQQLNTTSNVIFNGLNSTGDIFLSDGEGVVVGHDSFIDFGATPEFQVLGTGTSDSSMGFARFEDNTGGPDVRFLKSRGTTIGSNVMVQDGDTLGRFRFQGADEIDFNTVGAEILGQVDGSPSGNDIPGRLVFKTRIDDGALTEKMRLTNDGRLGIGTTDPQQLLNVDGTVNITGGLNLSSYLSCETLETDANGNVVCGTDANTISDFNLIDFQASFDLNVTGAELLSSSELNSSYANLSRTITYANISNFPTCSSIEQYFSFDGTTITCEDDDIGNNNIFDQQLNTTDKVFFEELNASQLFANGVNVSTFLYNQTDPAQTYSDAQFLLNFQNSFDLNLSAENLISSLIANDTYTKLTDFTSAFNTNLSTRTLGNFSFTDYQSSFNANVSNIVVGNFSQTDFQGAFDLNLSAEDLITSSIGNDTYTKLIDFQSAFLANQTNIFDQDLNETSTPTFDNLTITSNLTVLGTSHLGSFTISDDLIVGNINISGVNNQIGINTLSPSHELNVLGSGNFTGDLFVQSINVTQFFYNQTLPNIRDFQTSFDANLSNVLIGNFSFTDFQTSFDSNLSNILIGNFSFTDFQASFDLNHSEINFNPFDQTLNITSAPTFDNLTITSNLTVLGTSHLGNITITATQINVEDILPIDTQINLNNTLFVNASGRVGIGTTDPNALLDVDGNVIITGTISDDAGTLVLDDAVQMLGDVEIESTAPILKFDDSNGGVTQLLQSGNTIFFQSAVTETGGSAGAFSFVSWFNSDTWFHITSVGRIGVGINNPSVVFHVMDSSNPTFRLEEGTSPGTSYFQISNVQATQLATPSTPKAFIRE